MDRFVLHRLMLALNLAYYENMTRVNFEKYLQMRYWIADKKASTEEYSHFIVKVWISKMIC